MHNTCVLKGWIYNKAKVLTLRCHGHFLNEYLSEIDAIFENVFACRQGPRSVSIRGESNFFFGQLEHRSRIYIEEKAKVVDALWGTDLF